MGLGMARTGAAECDSNKHSNNMSVLAPCNVLATCSVQVVICIDNIYWTQEVAAAIEPRPEQRERQLDLSIPELHSLHLLHSLGERVRSGKLEEYHQKSVGQPTCHSS